MSTRKDSDPQLIYTRRREMYANARSLSRRSPQRRHPRISIVAPILFKKPLASRASVHFEFFNYGKGLMRKVHLWLHTPFFVLIVKPVNAVFFPISHSRRQDLLFRLAWFLRASFALLRPTTSSFSFFFPPLLLASN